MGLEANQVKRTFVRVKGKQLFTSEDKDFAQPFTRISGTLTKLAKKDLKTKDGQPFTMLGITLNDNGETYEVSVPYRDGYALSFLSALENADLTQKLYISPSQIENAKDGKVYVTDFLNIFQGNDQKQSIVRQYYSVNGEGDKKMPRIEWVQIGRAAKKVKDDSALQDFMDGLVARFNEKLGNPVAQTVASSTDNEDEVADDLPF